MLITKFKSKKVEYTTGKQCDKCKKVYDEETDPNSFEQQEFHHVRFCGGYASVFGDMSEVSCDICQHCLYEMIKDFCIYK